MKPPADRLSALSNFFYRGYSTCKLAHYGPKNLSNCNSFFSSQTVSIKSPEQHTKSCKKS